MQVEMQRVSDCGSCSYDDNKPNQMHKLNMYFNSSSYIMLGTVGEDGEKRLQECHEMGRDLKERSIVSV